VPAATRVGLALLAFTVAVIGISAAIGKRAAAVAPAVASARPSTQEVVDDSVVLAPRKLLLPVQGIRAENLRDTFEEKRGLRRHEALDIMAPRGTPVLATAEGRVAKLFHSAFGGITVYQFDPDEKYVYYYAHLDSYAEGLKEGMPLARGQVLGYVGSTGNAPANAPHLHFSIFRLGPDHRWWKGTAINPYPFLRR
jgi:murein DD-endopeptidase MepM/ murein hydrolase activator NlpD